MKKMCSKCRDSIKKIWKKWIFSFFQKFCINRGWKEGQESLKFWQENIAVIGHYIYSGKRENERPKGAKGKRYGRTGEPKEIQE